MKYLVMFTTAFIIFLVIFFPALISFGIRFIPKGIQSPIERVENIEGYQTVTQYFLSEEDRLTGFAMSIKNPFLRNKKDIILSVYDGSLEPIRVSVLNGKYIEDGAYIKFLFDPINDSKNKSYYFTLAAPTATTEDSLQVFYTSQKLPNMGKLFYGKEEISGFAVGFVSLYKPLSVFAPGGQIYNDWINRQVKDLGFMICYISLLIGLAGYLIYSNMKHPRE